MIAAASKPETIVLMVPKEKAEAAMKLIEQQGFEVKELSRKPFAFGWIQIELELVKL